MIQVILATIVIIYRSLYLTLVERSIHIFTDLSSYRNQYIINGREERLEKSGHH